MASIRPSQATEIDLLIRIWRRAVDATHDFLDPGDRAAIDAEVRQFLPSVPIWVAVDRADQPMGFMILSDGHMEALFIDPSLHRRGIGRRLVEHALSLAEVLTTDVNEQNAGAIQFYERLGFTRTGRSPQDHQGRDYPLLHMRLE
jgi:putative acetyltransferase